MDTLFHLLMLACLLLIVVGGSRLLGEWLHPAPAMATLWLVVLSSYLLLPHHLRPIANETLVVVVVAAATFALGSMLASFQQRLTPVSSSVSRWRSTPLRPILFWISLLGLPLFLLKAQALADAAAYTESSYINLRIALTGELDDAQTFGLLAYLIPISFASALVELAASKRRLFELRGWFALALALSYAVMATGRTYVFMLVIAIFGVALLQGRARPLQIVLTALGAFALAFFGLGSLANKIGVDIVNTEALPALDALSLYLLGSLAAFDVTLAQSPWLEWGANVFRSPMAVLAAFGLDVQIPSLVKPYVYVPEPTNVYTVFLPYYLDFGWAGIAMAFTFFGWLHGRLYLLARVTRSPRIVILTALSIYPLLMQFFQDQYFSLMTTWITFTLLVWPCFRAEAGIASNPAVIGAPRP